MDQIRFVINRNKTGLTWEEFETIELAQEGDVKMRRLRPLVARFMVDESGQPLPHEQAIKVLGKLPLDEVKDVFQKFAEAMTNSAVPLANRTPSSSPSAANSAAPSPDGLSS
jgi:hypothetical protein